MNCASTPVIQPFGIDSGIDFDPYILMATGLIDFSLILPLLHLNVFFHV